MYVYICVFLFYTTVVLIRQGRQTKKTYYLICNVTYKIRKNNAYKNKLFLIPKLRNDLGKTEPI